jgi:Uma2 family endonuclease
MSTVSQKKYYTPEEYLALEKASLYKSEYYRGEIFAMAGASFTHNVIVANLVASLHSQLKGTTCRPLASDQRVRVCKSDLYTYPDVTVLCGDPLFDKLDDHAIINPRVIIEVLSETTEKYDRGTKLNFYRELESLAEYILVSQNAPHFEQYVRQANNSWLLTFSEGLNASLLIESIQCRLLLAEIYDGVTFEGPIIPPNA